MRSKYRFNQQGAPSIRPETQYALMSWSWSYLGGRCTIGLLACFALGLLSSSIASAAEGLWIADSDELQVVEVRPGQLKHSGSPKLVVNQSTAIVGPLGVCFDKANNLWVSSETEELQEFTASQLRSLRPGANSPTPVVMISSSSFENILGCNFDSHGNLWLTDVFANSIYEISATQLKAGSGSITPAVIISDATEFDFPNFLAFDSSGNLWVSQGGGNVLLEFTAMQLESGGSKLASVKISSNAGSLDGPGQFGFDAHGNLWVTNDVSNTVVMFKNRDLEASGTPVPAVILSSASFNEPFSLAIQPTSGSLWIRNFADNSLLKFLPSQIKNSGSPKPVVALNEVARGALEMTFGPAFGKPGGKGLGISGFSPSCGPFGSNVGISGDDLKHTEGVTFGGSIAMFSVNSDTLVTAKVPSGGGGRIFVSTPDGHAISDRAFKVGFAEGQHCTNNSQCCSGFCLPVPLLGDICRF